MNYEDNFVKNKILTSAMPVLLITFYLPEFADYPEEFPAHS